MPRLPLALVTLLVLDAARVHAAEQTPMPTTTPTPTTGACSALQVHGAWIRLLPATNKTTAAFFVVKNPGDADAELVAADATFSGRVELHTHLHESGVMKMRQVPAVVIKAKSETVFRPMGLHVMFFDVTASWKEGDKASFRLQCRDGSRVTVDAIVAKDAPAPATPPPTAPSPTPAHR